MIISVEGLPGAGKTTQARLLAQHFTAAGHRAAYLPDLATMATSPLGQKLITLFTASRDLFKRSGDVITDTHLAAAIRADIAATLLTPALADHDIVIEDRGLHTMQSFSLATLLRGQRNSLDVDNAIAWLTAISTLTGPGPSHALWLRPPAQIALHRAQTRDQQPYTLEQRTYLHAVETAYQHLADHDPRMIEIRIRPRDTPATVHQQITAILNTALAENGPAPKDPATP